MIYPTARRFRADWLSTADTDFHFWAEAAGGRRAALAIRILVVFDAVVFLPAALLHLGARIRGGFTVLAEPRIVPAAIVEGLCGVVFALSAYALFTRGAWAWPAAISAHVLALAGVLLGMYALVAGWGPRTTANDVYHRALVLVLVVGLALLFTPSARSVLRRGAPDSAS